MERYQAAAWAAIVTLIPSVARAQWDVQVFVPKDAWGSYAFGLDDGEVVGLVYLSDQQYHAAKWDVVTGVFTSLEPPGAIGSVAFGTNSGVAVGSVSFGAESHACIFETQDSTWVDLSSPEHVSSTAMANYHDQQVGYARFNDRYHASLWRGLPQTLIDLHPTWADWSQAVAVTESEQVGSAYFDHSGPHAVLWRGTSESSVDLNPAGASQSDGFGVGDNQQVGEVVINGVRRATLWSGTPESWLDLHPDSGFAASRANAIRYGIQAGHVSDCTNWQACIWYGDSQSYVNLHRVIPADLHIYASDACGLWSDGERLYVAGIGFGGGGGYPWRTLVWSHPIRRACFADLNNDGFVNGDDFDWFAENFESGEPAADLNGDCYVNGNDFDYFAAHFEVGC